MSRAEQAKQYFIEGYNCSQAVALAFCDRTDLTADQLKKLTIACGGGFGRQRRVCGAVSGLTLICGLLFSDGSGSPEDKKNIYAIEQELCTEFKKEFGSLICADLLSGANLSFEVGGQAEARSAEYYKKRPCSEIVYTAAKILEEYIDNHSI